MSFSNILRVLGSGKVASMELAVEKYIWGDRTDAIFFTEQEEVFVFTII